MIVSFALTYEQMVAGIKWQTRRFWKPKRAKETYRNSVLDCFTALPYVPNSKRFARATVIKSAYSERLGDITQESVNAEGFSEMTPAEFVTFLLSHNEAKTKTADDLVTVVNFEIFELSFHAILDAQHQIKQNTFRPVSKFTSIFSLCFIYQLITVKLYGELKRATSARNVKQMSRLNHMLLTPAAYDEIVRVALYLRSIGVEI